MAQSQVVSILVDYHIAYKELLAVLLAGATWGVTWKGRRVHAVGWR